MPTVATAKVGSKSVDPASRGSSPSANSGGMPGCSQPQKPIPGPGVKGGDPASMRKALTKKAPRGNATGAAGMVR